MPFLYFAKFSFMSERVEKKTGEYAKQHYALLEIMEVSDANDIYDALQSQYFHTSHV